MKNFILIITCLLTLSLQSMASSTPANFDAAKWQQLIQKVLSKGTATNTEIGWYMILSKIVPADTTQSHKADYISTIGEVSTGRYFPGAVTAVSETWTLTAEKNWDIEQWCFLLDMDGNLKNAVKSHLLETPDRFVLSNDSTPVKSVEDPEVLNAWGQKLEEWFNQP